MDNAASTKHILATESFNRHAKGRRAPDYIFKHRYREAINSGAPQRDIAMAPCVSLVAGQTPVPIQIAMNGIAIKTASGDGLDSA